MKEDEKRDGNHIDDHYIQSKPISEDKSNKINTINTRTLRGLLWIQRHFLGNMLIPLLLFLGPGMRNMWKLDTVVPAVRSLILWSLTLLLNFGHCNVTVFLFSHLLLKSTMKGCGADHTVMLHTHSIFPPNVSAAASASTYYCYLSELIHKNSRMNHVMSLRIGCQFSSMFVRFLLMVLTDSYYAIHSEERILNDLEALASMSVALCVNQMDWNGLRCGRALAAITQLELTANPPRCSYQGSGPDLLSWKINWTKGWRRPGPKWTQWRQPEPCLWLQLNFYSVLFNPFYWKQWFFFFPRK